MKKRTDLAIAVFSVLLLAMAIVAICFAALNRKQTQPQPSVDKETHTTEPEDTTDQKTEEVTHETVTIDVFNGSSQEKEPESETDESQKWTVKAYMGQIGIFRADGSLEVLLTTKIKALPKADQTLLEKGFQIYGKEEFNSVIEDYGD